MMNEGKNGLRFSWRGFFCNALLLLAAILLFALSHPNPLSLHGFPIAAYVAFVPLLVLVRRVSFGFSFLWGAAYGFLCYCAYSYWLAAFHPLALYVITALYLFWMALVLPLLKLADVLFPRWGYVLQWALWVGYEYVKTLGFNAYCYGIIGYSQWSWPLVIQIASVFGVWGLSALVVFPSAWIAGGVNRAVSSVETRFQSSLPAPAARTDSPDADGRFSARLSAFFSYLKQYARAEKIPGLCWLLFLAFTLVFGVVSQRDYSGYPSMKIALVQPNSDPWHGGLPAYRLEFQKLRRLSDDALRAHPDIDFVVWPETAFIPRIEWHYKYREDRESFNLVSDLLRYLDSAPVPFVIGNDDAVREMTDEGYMDRVDYNSVFVFYPGENVVPPRPERYRKTHLVPFTEHFPYKKTFPWIYDLLVANDTHFWEKGAEFTVFEVGDLRFSTPICFEDTFGYISRRFVNSGARAIVNLTNDAWAKDLCCQYQHLSMSVLRAVENRVPLVRSTATGQTAFVDPNGRVVSMAEPFSETWLVADVPVLPDNQKTLYRIWGDAWGVLFLCASLLWLCVGVSSRLFRRAREKKRRDAGVAGA